MRPEVLHPVVTPADVAAVADAASDPAVAMRAMSGLRAKILELTEAPDCVLTCNCTQALRTAMLICADQTGDGTAIIPDMTFVATAHAAMAAGLRPWLTDIDSRLLMAVGSVALAADGHSHPSVVVPVELLGRVLTEADVGRLQTIGAPIVVDAAQSFGATKWRHEYAAMVISFSANKIVHGHQGGAILFGPRYAKQFRTYIRHGREPGDESYHHISLGENLAMNPLAAAMALSQCNRIREIMNDRATQSVAYFQTGVIDNKFPSRANGWLHVGFRDRVVKGPMCDLWEPLHTMPHLAGFGHGSSFNGAMTAYRNLVALPSSADVRPEWIKAVYSHE